MEGQPSIAIGAYAVYPGKSLGRGSFADVFMATGPKVRYARLILDEMVAF